MHRVVDCRAIRGGLLVVAVAAGGCAGQPESAPSSQPSLASRIPSPVSATPRSCSFGIPANLGATLNTEGFDGGPALSSNGRRLYFISDRPGGQGGGDIWVAERTEQDAPFRPPTNLGPGVNGPGNEGAPTLSRDELTLFFDRDDGGIWTATRSDPGASFGQAIRLPSPVNHQVGAGFPALSADGLTLYFASKRIPREGGEDLWRATRTVADGPFTAVENLGPQVNDGLDDAMPAISADDLRLAFASLRAGRVGFWDLWLAQRSSPAGDWSSPENLGPSVNSTGFDGRPFLTSDGSALLFMSDRTGGQGGMDLWEAPADCAHT